MTVTAPPTTLRTERLLLRPFRDSDLDAFATMHADPRVVAHLHAPLTRAESEAVFGRIRANILHDGLGPFAVELSESEEFIGVVGLARPHFDMALMPCVEIAWRIASPHWGRGYATEAARASLDFGFRHHQLDEILAWTSQDNLASQRVMEKLGMRRDPDADFDHPKLPPGHRLRRHLVWRLPRPV
jgi:RimJ/RimL family protein N-acetyltransferase